MFKKGQSGNPNGRRSCDKNFLDNCRKYTVEALEVIAEVMRNGEEESDRLKAAIWLVERGQGKATQAVEVSGQGGGPLVAVLRDA